MRFADYGKRVVFAAFAGGEITSDAGVLLLREQARRIRLFERMAGCFTDHRERERLTHALPALLAQRVCVMALGYKDIIDHDTLRFDPALKLLASPRTGPLNSPSTGTQVNGRRLPCIGSPTPCEPFICVSRTFGRMRAIDATGTAPTTAADCTFVAGKPLNDSLQWSSNLLRNRLRVMFKRLEGFAKGTPASEH